MEKSRSDLAVPKWVTSWPEWFGVSGNVTVVPESDYLAIAERLNPLNSELELARKEAGFARLAYDQLVQRQEQEIQRALAIPVAENERLRKEADALRALLKMEAMRDYQEEVQAWRERAEKAEALLASLKDRSDQ